ncbi:MAG: glycosyltransferase family 9 protein [Gaiellaceae bacterium]
MRIAVLRALGLGDLLCAVPALRAFRRAFGEAEITLVGLPSATDFVERFGDYVDSLLEVPGYPGLPEPAPDVAAVPDFLREAQSRSFDLVVQLQDDGAITNPLAVLLGGSRTAGFYTQGAWCPDPEAFVLYPDRGPEPTRLLLLPERIGLPVDAPTLEFPVTDEDRAALAEALGGEPPAEYACIAPGARRAGRRWSPAGFAALADALVERGLAVVLTGSEEDAAVTAEVAAAMSSPATDAAGRTSLGAFGALLAGARLLVTNDSGASHVAAALRVPSVVVFTASDPRRWAPLDGALHRIVSAPVIRPELVLGEVERLLE